MYSGCTEERLISLTMSVTYSFLREKTSVPHYQKSCAHKQLIVLQLDKHYTSKTDPLPWKSRRECQLKSFRKFILSKLEECFIVCDVKMWVKHLIGSGIRGSHKWLVKKQSTVGIQLKIFIEECGLIWDVAGHEFRS